MPGSRLLALFLLGSALAAVLAGCAGTPTWGEWSTRPSYDQLQTARGIPADWVYYPAFELYYSRNHQQYVFREIGEWVAREEPVAPLTVARLEASLSVPMAFHDAPPSHHAEVTALYPKTWLPFGAVIAATP